MGELNRLTLPDLRLGTPLPWDVYDAAGHLLMRKGSVIEHSRQVERLVEEGLFASSQAMARAGSSGKGKEAKEAPSALRLINLTTKGLAPLLRNLSSLPNFPNLSDQGDAERELRGIANLLAQACDIDREVALASILLNQQSSPYPIRHGIDTGIVSLLVMRALKQPQEAVEIAVAAALTMNLGMLALQEKLQGSQEELSDEGRRVIRQHPAKSAEMPRRAGVGAEQRPFRAAIPNGNLPTRNQQQFNNRGSPITCIYQPIPREKASCLSMRMS